MAGNHKRNTAAMINSPRCGARTRAGTPCMAPAVSGQQRCRMHGGTNPGPPPGNRNALKDGYYSGKTRRMKTELQRLVEETYAIIEEGEAAIDRWEAVWNLKRPEGQK